MILPPRKASVETHEEEQKQEGARQGLYVVCGVQKCQDQ